MFTIGMQLGNVVEQIYEIISKQCDVEKWIIEKNLELKIFTIQNCLFTFER